MTPTVSAALEARTRAWRHHLHQHPETAFAEHETGAYVARVLRELGYEVTTSIGGTGLVGSLTRGTSAANGGTPLRARTPCLSQSRAAVDHASRHDGVMHACGHDGHLAMVLGRSVRPRGGRGARRHRARGLPARRGAGPRGPGDDRRRAPSTGSPVDRVFGIHNHPGTAAGRLLTRSGPVMASEDDFTIHVAGRGGHASAPHLVVDALVIGAEIVTALQHVVARSVDPVRTAVLSCTDFRTDGARNAIPSNVTITGDTRSFDPDVQAVLERRIREVSEGVARRPRSDRGGRLHPRVRAHGQRRRLRRDSRRRAAGRALGPDRFDRGRRTDHGQRGLRPAGRAGPRLPGPPRERHRAGSRGYAAAQPRLRPSTTRS